MYVNKFLKLNIILHPRDYRDFVVCYKFWLMSI